jgi:hypothetical protein
MYAVKDDHNIGFQENRQFVRKNWLKKSPKIK